MSTDKDTAKTAPAHVDLRTASFGANEADNRAIFHKDIGSGLVVIGGASSVGVALGAAIVGAASLPADALVAAAVGVVLGVAGTAEYAYGAYEHHVHGDKSPGADYAIKEMEVLPDLNSYSSQIQSHYLAVHPDKPAPQTPQDIAQALRDPAVFKEVRQAASGKDVPQGVPEALDEFAKLEKARNLEIARQASSAPPAPKAETQSQPKKM